MRLAPLMHLCASFALLATGLSLSPGCKKEEGKAKASPPPPMPGAPAQTEAELDAVLARIDGVEITVRDFQERINRQSPYIRARYGSTEQKKEFLDNLVRFEVLARKAKDEGFDKHPDVVRTMKQVMIQKLMKDRFENMIQPEDITDAEMKSYYDANPEEFSKPEEVRASAIVVSKKKVAEKAAKEAAGEAGASNKGFRELVAKYSEDKETKLRGGDLRYFTAKSEELPAEVVKAAFALSKTGEVSGVIAASDKKFYILKQTGRRKAINKSFDQVKRQLQNRIYRDKRTQAQQDFVEGLRKKAKIEVFEDKLKNIRIDTSSAALETDHGHHFAMPDEEAAPSGEINQNLDQELQEATP